jgi:hypothetical protein
MIEGSVRGNFRFLNFSANSQSISATTINANNFYGFFDAKYIGTGDTPNWVTNTEVGYLSNLTSNTQTQINTKASTLNTYLTYDNNQSISNYLFVTTGENVTISSDTTYYYVNIDFASLEVGVVDDTPLPDAFGRVNNYNPSGWNDTYPNRATVIRMSPNQTMFLTGLVGGVGGRICYLINNSNNLIILPNTSPNSSVGNKFISTYYLRPYKTVKLIYFGINWRFLEYFPTLGMDYSDNLKSIDYESGAFGANFKPSYPLKSDYFVFSAMTSIMSDTRSRPFWRGDNYAMDIFAYGINQNTAANNRSVWGWGLSQFTNNQTLKYSGKSNTFISSFGILNFLLPLSGSTVLVAGWQNSNFAYGYSAATNGYTSFPNLGGGIFFLSDVNLSTNLIAAVQTPDGNTITGLTSTSYQFNSTIGIHTINSSGSSYGKSTFFSVSDERVTNVITHTGLTQNSPFGVWGYANNRTLNSTNINSGRNIIKVTSPSFATDFLK